MVIDLDQLKDRFQFTGMGACELQKPLTINFYEKWLASDYHAEMLYLKNHLPQKVNAKLIHSELLSALTVSQSYFPIEIPITEDTALEKPISARTALYAQNQDYHFWLKEKLSSVIDLLKESYPEHIFLPFTDSGPVLERDLAYRSQLGWFGKNSCLIHPQKGSLFFIAEILTSLPISQIRAETKTTKTLSNDFAPLPDFCGTCTRCMDICPTQALIEPRVLKADQCISYLTIESRKIPPEHLRKEIGDWFFGCDLCQTICPWNQKIFKKNELYSNSTSTKNLLELSGSEEEDLALFLKEILSSSNNQIQKKFRGTALLRAGGFGLKRNALIVIANRNIKTLQIEVENYISDPKLGELAQWTLDTLLSANTHSL